MSLSRNLGQYADVQRVFDTVLKANGPVHLSFPTASKAARWRFRAYFYRKLLHEQAVAMGETPGTTATPYDSFVIRKPSATQLTLLREAETEFVMEADVDESTAVSTEPDDNLAAQAEAFIKSLSVKK